ncbi:hypothetical protein DFH11DRAFT_1616026 [Phellopilus nigrolimitatus]|nr:hypothetical protein DFH11DRAFT_1616026 [Phellopilus nigrolimitatus]
MVSQGQGIQTFDAVSLAHYRISSYLDAGTFTILIYDYMITLSSEMRLIWPMPFKSPAKILFLLTRYMPFFDMSILFRSYLGIHTPEYCVTAYRSIGWLLIAGFITAEAILVLRTWAVWERSRAIGIGLAIWFIVIWGTNLAITDMFMNTMKVSPLPAGFSGCEVTAGSPIIVVDWILLVVFDSGLLVLMVIKSIQRYNFHGHSLLFKTVYRDGTVFYIYLLGLTVANIIVMMTLPDDLKTVLFNFERVIHAILTERILLSLRSLANGPGGDSFSAGADVSTWEVRNTSSM